MDHQVIIPFKLDLSKVSAIADEIEKLEDGIDHFLGNRSYWKLTNIPKMFRHAFIRNYIVRMSEITDKVQWFQNVLNKFGTVAPNPDVPTVMMPTDPFGDHVALVPELRKAMYDAEVLAHYIKKEYDHPTLDDHIEGPWEIFSCDAWKDNIYALYVLYLRIQTLPVLSPIMNVAIHRLTNVCECISYERAFENTQLKDAETQGFIIKLWDDKGSMKLEHCDKQVYFTQEEREEIERKRQDEIKRQAEAEAAEKRRQLVAEFVKLLTDYVNKSDVDKPVRKIFTPGLLEQFNHPDEDTVQDILALKKLVDWGVDGMNASCRTELFVIILNLEDSISIADNVKEDIAASTRLIRFFTKNGYKACGLPLMEIVDGTESDESLATFIRINHEIQLSK